MLTIYKDKELNNIKENIALDTINPLFIDIPKNINNLIRIDKSTIKDCGYGAFAKTNIKKGMFLGNYVGNILHKVLSFNNNPYLFNNRLGKNNIIIDGSQYEHSNWTRFLNCASKDNKQNVIVLSINFPMDIKNINNDIIDVNGYMLFWAIDDINEGDELFFDYGEEYRKLLLDGLENDEIIYTIDWSYWIHKGDKNKKELYIKNLKDKLKNNI